MKAILLIFVAIVVFGGMWYSGILPLNDNNSTVSLSPTPENIQQISNILSPDDQKIIFYSYEQIPEIPEKQIPLNAINKAIDLWEKNNPDYKFVESENSNIDITWKVYASTTHSGLATCNTVLFGILSHCVVEISVGTEDCNGNFLQNDENMVTNILMHEIGHTLGLTHSSEESHLMYSPKSPDPLFDSKGLKIPEKLPELYVGQKDLLEKESLLREEIEKLDQKISVSESQYNEYKKHYQYYENKSLSADEYRESQTILKNLNSEFSNVNSLISTKNSIIDELNSIVYELGCHPNFELAND